MIESLSAEQTGAGDLVIRCGSEVVAEIRNLRVILARFRPGGPACIGSTVPLPLFWMQYANHQDPERNAGSDVGARYSQRDAASIVITGTGSTASGACRSEMVLAISMQGNPPRLRYRVTAHLDVVSKDGWAVTPNPEHGEVEFANIWPDGSFSSGRGGQKLYQACVVSRSTGATRIPHNHLESSDKRNIALTGGDRFLWILEDENPCLTLESLRPVSAGICAYMWDAHFAYKVCSSGHPVTIPTGSTFDACYTLEGLNRQEANRITQRASQIVTAETRQTPLYLPGLNRFAVFLDDLREHTEDAWPWETEIGPGSEAHVSVDHQTGFDDTHSAKIEIPRAGRARWKATTIGPAYGQPEFVAGSSFRLSARAKCADLVGRSTIALRLHREGREGLFDPGTYEVFESRGAVQGNSEWTVLQVTTPPISPCPDRVHILLSQDGAGTTWFDNVLFEVLP